MSHSGLLQNSASDSVSVSSVTENSQLIYGLTSNETQIIPKESHSKKTISEMKSVSIINNELPAFFNLTGIQMHLYFMSCHFFLID